MGSFSLTGYFFDLPHDFCTPYEVSQKRFERLAVFVKITASRSSYLFLQQTVTNPIISQSKVINEKLRTFNFVQNKKRLIANSGCPTANPQTISIIISYHNMYVK